MLLPQRRKVSLELLQFLPRFSEFALKLLDPYRNNSHAPKHLVNIGSFVTEFIPTSLGDIRAAIRKGRRMTFRYENVKFVADIFRYALIKDLEPVGKIDSYRSDFDPEMMLISSIDTIGPVARKQPPN